MADRIAIVTGAGGFIGTAVCNELAAAGYTIRALVGPPESGIPAPAAAALNIWASITDGPALQALFAGPVDAVVHLAGPPSVRTSFEDPVGFAVAHTAGTAAMLEAARHARTARFVYVSSAEVYGRPQTDPVPESHALEARSPYGAAKIGAEQMVRAFGHAYGMRAVIVRPFSVYGVGMGQHALLPAIIGQLDTLGPIRLADLRPERDYCHVDDVARAIAAAAAADIGETLALNVGSGCATSVGDLAALVVRSAGQRRAIEADRAAGRPGNADILRLVADRTRASDVLGWEPRVSLAMGVRSMLQARGITPACAI
jgi:nucleoside-diphosphate-sugar epimerase